MQPSPIEDTTGPTAPNFRSFMARKTTPAFALVDTGELRRGRPAFARSVRRNHARLCRTGFGVAGYNSRRTGLYDQSDGDDRARGRRRGRAGAQLYAG